LARLSFTDEEISTLTAELSRVLDYVSVLDAVDTENITPLHMLHAHLAPPRNDSVSPSLSHDEALRNAPEAQARLIRVPRVL
jgi:aspartyl-tRNA(Asn)/glutamyl-tRNA(Gln) amidotransferase subunit C